MKDEIMRSCDLCSGGFLRQGMIMLCILIIGSCYGCNTDSRGTSDSKAVNAASNGEDNPEVKPVNMAINGEGYFYLIKYESGTVDFPTSYYTRLGSFTVSKENILINPQGYALQGWILNDACDHIGTLRDIVLPPQSQVVTVSSDGIIYAQYPDETVHPVFRIVLVRFRNPEKLQDEDDGTYRITYEAGDAITAYPGATYTGPDYVLHTMGTIGFLGVSD